MDNLLEKIDFPKDLQKFSISELNELCDEIREKIIKTVSNNGGHLASNLGVVELTIALHKVFPSENDKIVWDVGHQSYTHKILTGRRDSISTIRTKGGLSGYPNRQESPYDAFNAGHSSTSISAALGIANAKNLTGEPGHVIAVIGDGALTGGLAYEGLNNAGRFKKNFIVILNDNKMSISRNVGSMARYLAHIRTKPGYFRVKGNVENALDRLPHIGQPIHHFLSKSKMALKQILYNNTIFDYMGFYYYGPFDGHDLEKLIDVLENAKNINHPVLLHVLTRKGKGYSFAEQNPGAFHGIASFDIKTGKSHSSGESFSSVFGNHLCTLAANDSRICAITAAMQMGTGLTGFARQYPERFFDTGIAEEHAVTFAGGLASGGMHPVFAVYSTFLQRGYDQIIHDAAIQRVKVTFAIDRAGVVGEDGETHQGIFDVAFLNTIPNITVFSPAYYDEMYRDLDQAIYHCDGISAVRYPRGKPFFKPYDFESKGMTFDSYGEKNAKIVIVTYGRLFSFACKAISELKNSGISVRIIKLNRIIPVDPDAIADAANAATIFFFEEGIQQGGVGEHFSFLLNKTGYKGKYFLRAITNFVPHATMLQSLSALGLDDKEMVNMILTECKH
ncbi:1-deoxy-D-xylulose-5-phosphate synthase [Caproiciproducens galactitolivorans]|uniref:1-deoxy-D-xylulose-5-phosphate synthase n=1 Tax=Caproiciproducens galactitolivorans TaxID=642589 RepID=A0ABT4BQS8_9FIRM|nr:1-deoxy-D-xylulose-5-phosphate synthase [Caproiciproducens galactitolivorans]MCY1713236.1 1-deoxy-D-xylulose-5-phosphate synthase [Caproiciproducens galactitolivorans]